MAHVHPSFTELLALLRARHRETPAIAEFCAFPDDPPQTPFDPYLSAAGTCFLDYARNFEIGSALVNACVQAAPYAHWRETYKGPDADPQFVNRFGCFGVISNNAPWHSDNMRAFLVCMPQHMTYPAHQHPAEEIYHVIAGEAEFHRRGAAPEWIGQGGSVVHSSNQPHAMRTGAAPVLAYVVWRNNLTTLPVWSAADDSSALA